MLYMKCGWVIFITQAKTRWFDGQAESLEEEFSEAACGLIPSPYT